MHCLKCGREIEEGQVFCQECLLDMSRHPVDPNAVVFVPRKPDAPAQRKQPKRRTRTPEEQVLRLKRRIRVLTVLLVVLLVLAGSMVYPTVRYLQRYRLRPGQNYTSITTTSPVVSTWGTTP